MVKNNLAITGSKRWILAIWLGATLANVIGCRVNPDHNDSTPPTVELKYRNALTDKQFVAAADARLSVNDSLVLTCAASDAGGVQSASLSFETNAGPCTVGTTAYPGSYSLPVGITSPVSTTDTPDAQGKVSDKLFMLKQIDGTSFSCYVPNAGQGTLYGPILKAVCRGSNWAGQSAEATMNINVEPGFYQDDTSPPDVYLKYRSESGEYVEGTEVYPSAPGLDVQCTISDANGIHSGRLTFAGEGPYCCKVNGIDNCKSMNFPFLVEPALPDTVTTTFVPDDANPQTSITLSGAVAESFTCKVGGDVGVPVNYLIKVACEAENWSQHAESMAARKTLTVHVN